MEIKSLELTIDDILSIHRQWITKLYIHDNKTKAEIAGMLYERHLFFTHSQIHDCLINWEVIPSTSVDTNSSSSALYNTSDVWEVIPPPCPVSASDATTDPPIHDLYTKSPRPSVPTTKVPKRGSIDRSQDPLKVICRHRPPSHKVETILDFVPKKSSPLEAYTSTEQVRERFAIGLWGIFEMDDSWDG
ncbi:hypothetical protein B0J14DRAFT_170383 [Halenospora varia]|nr:hypothetical protein B0J14DRAFT_170383 [Halenospora varia]